MTMGAALLSLAAALSPVDEAERLAAEATRAAATRPVDAIALARRALAVTAEFDPIAFVRAGRKGEVVEDTFQAARAAYRQHRAVLYEAAGVSLEAAGKHEAASRYLRRALVLEADVRARVRAGPVPPRPGPRARSARPPAERGRGGAHARRRSRLFEQAADVAGLPSAQAEIDRARLRA